jgi:hypothetical protein
MKSEVYSWRVSADLKIGLEREARRRKTSVSAVLDLAARDWLNKGASKMDSDEEQLLLRKAAAKCFGALASGNPYRSENARQTVRSRLPRDNDR